MQIHELNTFAGTPGDSNFLAIDNGSDTGKISGTNLLKPVNDRVDNLVASVSPDSAVVLLDRPNGINAGANTLSQSVANFDYLEFYVGAAGDMKTIGGYIRVPVDQGGVEINIPAKSGASLYDQQIKLTWSGTTLNQTAYNVWEWDGVASDGATSQTSTWVAQVIRVVGIKTSSTTSAEIADARLGANGVTYPTLGAAIRGQVNDLNAELNDETTKKTATPSVEDGKWIDTDGAETSQNGYSVTDFVDVSKSTLFEVSDMSVSNYIYYCFYDSSKNPIGSRTRCYNDIPISVVPNAYYLRITTATGNFAVGKIYLTSYTRITLLEQTTNNLNDVKTINPTNLIVDYVLKASTDEILSSDKFVCTDYLDLPFEENEDFKIIGTFSGIGGAVIYDADKTKILGIDGDNVASYGGTSGNTIQTIEVPYQSGMKYIRVSGWKALVGTDVTKLGVIGKTFAGAYPRIFDAEKKVYANISDSISKSKVLVIGDSISTDSYGNYPKWVTNLIKKGFLPYDTNNSSQHATGFVARYNNQPNDFITRIKAVSNPNQYDLVIVFGGINDYIQNIPMGSESGTDYTVSFKPAVNEFFAYLIENFVQARICVLLPLRTSTTTRNTAGEYQQAYSDYIKQVAKSYCLPILKLTEESGFYPYVDSFKDMWTLLPSGYTSHDGVHPTEEYEAKYLTPMIRHFLQGLM